MLIHVYKNIVIQILILYEEITYLYLISDICVGVG